MKYYVFELGGGCLKSAINANDGVTPIYFNNENDACDAAVKLKEVNPYLDLFIINSFI